MSRRAAEIYDGEDVERCRRARRQFEQKFGTLDEMFDYCEHLRKRRGMKTTRAKAKRSNQPVRTTRQRNSSAQRLSFLFSSFVISADIRFAAASKRA